MQKQMKPNLKDHNSYSIITSLESFPLGKTKLN